MIITRRNFIKSLTAAVAVSSLPLPLKMASVETQLEALLRTGFADKLTLTLHRPLELVDVDVTVNDLTLHLAEDFVGKYAVVHNGGYLTINTMRVYDKHRRLFQPTGGVQL